MKPINLSFPALAALCLSASLLHAELERKEISNEGGWSVASLTEDGKPAGAEMLLANTGKQEFHMRLRVNDSGVFLDATQDWSALAEEKAQRLLIRINNPMAKAKWKGEGKVIEDEDGQTWLRAELTDADSGQVDETVLEAMMEGGNTIYWSVGTGDKSAKWQFALDGAKAAYETMQNHLQNSDGGDGAAQGKSEANGGGNHTEHEYGRFGDWAVHYYTDKNRKFVQASIIRYFDDSRILRWSETATHYHLDVTGDWAQIDGAAKDKDGNIIASLTSDEEPDYDEFKIEGKQIDEEGDKWLRFSQSFEEPGGMEDGVRNAKNLRLRFGPAKFWSFDLKGSHAAREKLQECIEKHKK